MSSWSQFVQSHWVVGGILTSLLWFVAGEQSFSNKRIDTAIVFESVAILIILAFCGWSIVEGEWLGLVLGIAVMGFEFRFIRRVTAMKRLSRS